MTKDPSYRALDFQNHAPTARLQFMMWARRLLMIAKAADCTTNHYGANFWNTSGAFVMYRLRTLENAKSPESLQWMVDNLGFAKNELKALAVKCLHKRDSARTKADFEAYHSQFADFKKERDYIDLAQVQSSHKKWVARASSRI